MTKPDGTPYAVFTPFYRAWSRLLAEGGPGVVVADLNAPVVEYATLRSDTVEWSDGSDVALDLPAAGERAAWERWETFRDAALADYATARDIPSIDGTSRLSTYLRWGVLHPSQLMQDMDGSASAESYRRELCWREFYADVLFHRPESAWHNLDRRFDRMELDTDASARERFERWQAGRTGFPIVDAGMRQLAATGWMHNRVRMITASFLVKDLHLPWQWGARHFMDHLVAGDLTSNNHGWQWVAGCGTDAAPYHRILNPTLQGERFDPAGEYQQQWIEEWPLTEPPMVDHAVERVEALRRRSALSVA